MALGPKLVPCFSAAVMGSEARAQPRWARGLHVWGICVAALVSLPTAAGLPPCVWSHGPALFGDRSLALEPRIVQPFNFTAADGGASGAAAPSDSGRRPEAGREALFLLYTIRGWEMVLGFDMKARLRLSLGTRESRTPRHAIGSHDQYTYESPILLNATHLAFIARPHSIGVLDLAAMRVTLWSYPTRTLHHALYYDEGRRQFTVGAPPAPLPSPLPAEGRAWGGGGAAVGGARATVTEFGRVKGPGLL